MEAVERTGRRQCWDVPIISPTAPRNLLAKIRQEELEVQGPLFRKGVDDVKLLDHLLCCLGIPAFGPLLRVGTLRSIKTMLLACGLEQGLCEGRASLTLAAAGSLRQLQSFVQPWVVLGIQESRCRSHKADDLRMHGAP